MRVREVCGHAGLPYMLFAVELVMSVSIVWVVPCAHLERRVLYAWPFLRVCTRYIGVLDYHRL
jgi:hypothetical protein